MAKSWRGRTTGSASAAGSHHGQPPAARQAVLEVGVVGAPTHPTWRYRMLLLAIGSSTPDGSDVTASDRDLLLRMDWHLTKCAVTQGEDAARDALAALIEVLRSEPDGPQMVMH